ncbi:helix-turn-helix transcriptional regulator [Rhizobium sp. RU36D]|uniref:helix-turn-helix domain-containing protein n=1 Tax=Rhizobium sp. RU36D TaxID=1907415 RepID=UPI0009D7CDFF|nr:helix-turn-helix transcriptional regulator [Rhizobium sp. RU36D]SMD18240.1 Transcriptional regulator, contains XRE-family HTH domain [Rhizobium sp. RU36D]
MTRKELTGPIDRAAGARLCAIRKARNVSQEKLGAEIGVTFQQVQKYEKGTNRISISTLILISKALACHPMDIIGEAEDMPQRLSLDTLLAEKKEADARLAHIASLASRRPSTASSVSPTAGVAQ